MNIPEQILDSSDTPCTKFACPARSKCGEGLACNAWLLYVRIGKSYNPMRFALPTEETFILAEGDGLDNSRIHWKSVVLDQPDLWAKAFPYKYEED